MGYRRRARKSPVAASTKARRKSIGRESVGTAGAATGSGVLVGVGLAVAVGVGLGVVVGVGLGVTTVRVAEAGPPLGASVPVTRDVMLTCGPSTVPDTWTTMLQD